MSQSNKYYVYINEAVQGPYDLQEIAGMNLDEQTQVCIEGSTDWVSLKAVASDPLANFVNQSAAQSVTEVGKYTIVKEIGQGGMGAVYLAVDKLLNRKVAIKELKMDDHKKKDPDAYSVTIKRFQREAQILAQLNHKNIVSVYDVIEQNGSQYIIMEFLDGKDLEQILEQLGGVMPMDQAASIMSDTCLALDYIHQRSIIHRDIKPSNIFILDDGVVKLTDFGVTKDLNSMTMTVDGSLVGTIAYASPEQDSRELDGRSDVFSLGVVLYEIVTGQKPFTGDTIASVLLKIATKEPTKPSEINPKIHKMLENIIVKAMAKTPAKRYQSAMEMNSDLNEYRTALANNTTSLLSGMKSNDSFMSSSSKAVDYNVKSVAKGISQPLINNQVNTPLANNNSPIPLKSTNLNDPVKQTRLGVITQQSKKPADVNFDMPNPFSEQPNQQPQQQPQNSNQSQIANKVDQLINSQMSSQDTFVNPESEFKRGSTEELEEEFMNILESNSTLIEEKIIETPKEEKVVKPASGSLKYKSAAEEQRDKDNFTNKMKIIVPAVVEILFILLALLSVINGIDAVFLTISLVIVCLDFFSKEIIKPISYIVMLIGTYSGWFITKSFMSSIDISKISNAMFYMLDFSILLISFIVFFFILKMADNFSANKNKSLRPLGGIIKSFIIILGFVFSISSTSIVESSFFQKQFEKSKLIDISTSFVTNFKQGKKSNISFGRPAHKPNIAPVNNKK